MEKIYGKMNRMKKQLVIIGIVAILVTVGFSGCNEENNTLKPEKGYTDITVEKAYNFLTNTSNGIQIPIDIRTNFEWETAHIDTPYPENAQHWPNLQNGENLTEFIELYQGKEIILYCRAANRSTTAANLLVEHNFDGTIYNMLGGINAWIFVEYPTKANS